MRRVIVCLLLTAATAAIYARVASFGFVNFDDWGYVRDNARVLAGLTQDGIVWAFTTTSLANWHPLTWLSLQLDAQLFGTSPQVFHTTNIVLHVVNTLLLFLLFDRMTRSTWPSAFVAALFAVHPLHVESVAWVAERKDVLSAAFGLLACHAWFGWVGRGGRARYALAVAAYAASLLAKPMLVSLPLLLLLFDVWPLDRANDLRRRIVEKVPLFVLAAALCVMTVLAQASGGATRSVTQYPLSGRAANAVVTYVTYLVKAVWPSGLAVYYPYPYGGTPAWQVAGSVAILGLVTAACVRSRARAPYLFVGWFWYLITLVPVIGLVKQGSQAMADRYTYLPLIGPFAMLAYGLSDLLGRAAFSTRRVARGAAAALACAALLTLSVLAWRQAGYWSDSVTLFTHALAVTTENAVAENSLAQAFFERGDIDRAMPHCEAAVRIAPGMADAQSNLVRGLLAQGRTEEAASRVREALALRPDDSRTHVNAGLIARLEGRNEDAMRSFREALRLDPTDQEAHLNLGAVLSTLGETEEAIVQFEEAARLRPGDLRARRALESISRKR